MPKISGEKPSKKSLVFNALLIVILSAFGAWLIVRFFDISTLYSVKLQYCLVTLPVVIFCWATHNRQRTVLGIIATVLLGSLAISAIYLENHQKFRGNSLKKLHSWNIYHYILGSKYFDELGYYDLYNATLLADQEMRKPFLAKAVRTRNLHTYKSISVKRAKEMAEKEGLRQRFTNKRWRQFKRDQRTIFKQSPPAQWAITIRDLGFNPSPVWLIAHRPFLNTISITKRRALHKLAMAQLPFFALAFAMIWWAFGIRVSFVCTLWMALYFGNSGRLLGGYFSYDWFYFAVFAVALYKKGYQALSAPFLAYSAMMRGITGMLALQAAVVWAVRLVKNRRLDAKTTRYGVALVLCCLILVGLGSTTDYGFSAWKDWKENISRHAENHALDSIRVGLQMSFSKKISAYKEGEAHFSRKQIQAENRPLFKSVQIAMILLTLIVMIRRNPHDGAILGLIVAYTLVVLSRYYFSAWVLIFTLGAIDKRRIINLIVWLWMFVLPALYAYEMSHGGNKRDTYYQFNVGITLMFAFILVSYAVIDWMAWKKKKADAIKSESESEPMAQENVEPETVPLP